MYWMVEMRDNHDEGERETTAKDDQTDGRMQCEGCEGPRDGVRGSSRGGTMGAA